jgi:hypothetical protein
MTPAELSVVPRTCESCGAPLGPAEGEAGFANLCAGCNGFAAPDKVDRPTRRLTQGERSARCRATSEPPIYPVCGRHHEGLGLAHHLRLVHQATMRPAHVGRLTNDDLKAGETAPPGQPAQRTDSNG